MAEYKLGRIRFVWKGDWAASTAYYKDDVVRVGGRTFICQVGHSSSPDFNTDLEYNPTKWNQLTDGQSFTGDWSTSTFYQIRDVVKYGGLLYICTDSHTSAATVASGLEADQAKWTLFAEGIDWKGNWTTSTRYKINDLVRYGGYTYICNRGHTSAVTATTGLENDQAYWDTYNPGIEYKGAWANAVRYKINDVVRYGAGSYICTAPHTSSSVFASDSANWESFVKGFEFANAWTPTTYKIGDVVTYGGNQYVSINNHSSTAFPSTDTTNWNLFSEGFNFSNAWSISSSYRVGDVVTQSGYAYLCVADCTGYSATVTNASTTTDTFVVASTSGLVQGMAVEFSGATFGGVGVSTTYFVKQIVNSTDFTITDTFGGTTKNLSTASGSMTVTANNHPTNTAYFSVLSSGMAWRDEWQDDSEYNPGDVVRFGSNAYICVNKHRSEGDDGSTISADGGGSDNSRPDLDTTGTFWNLLAVGSEIDVLTTTGDLVYYGGAGPTRLPVGLEGQILRVSENEIPEWATLGQTAHTYYVAEHGVDLPAPIWGLTWDKPWKTIRYACEQVEDGPIKPNAQELLELNRVFIQRETSKWIEYQIENFISPFSNVTVVTISSNDTLETASPHGLAADRKLVAKTTDSGIVAETVYFVLSEGLTNTQFKVSLTRGGAAVTGLTNGTSLSIEMKFDFDEYKCERDVGFLVDALIYDLGHGGNIKTRGAANSYVGGLTEQETVPYGSGLANEAVESIAAITYMLSLVQDVLNQEAPAVNYQILNGDSSTAVVSQYFNTSIVAESGAYNEAASLVQIVTDAITAGIPDDIPARYSPSNLINVATGRYREVLPIRVPEQTCVMGAELRSTNAGPMTGTTPKEDSFFTRMTLDRVNVVAQDIIQGNTVTATSGNTELQNQAWPYSNSLVANTIDDLMGASAYNIKFRTGYDIFQSSDPTGYNSSYLIGYGYARYLVQQNKEFFKEELTSWISLNYPTLKYSRTKCKQDVGYIVDAIVYDLTYGGNAMSVQAGLAYWEGTARAIDSSELTATLAAYNQLKSIMQSVASASVFTALNTVVPQYSSGTAGSAAAISLIGSNLDEMIDIVQNGVSAATLTDPSTSWVSGALTSAYSTLTAAQTTIINNVIDELNEVAWHTDFTVSASNLTNDDFEIYVGKNDITHTYVSGGTVTKEDGTELTVTNFVYNNSTGIATVTTSSNHGLIAGDIVDIVEITVSCYHPDASPTTQTTVYPSAYGTRNGAAKVRYIQNKCIRDIGIILKAVSYDFMFNSTFQSELAGRSYLRSTALEVFSLGQKAITRSALENVRTGAIANVGGEATAISRINALMELIDHIIFSGSNEGSRCASDDRMVDYAILQIERNRDFLIAEADAYIAETFKSEITNTTSATNVLTIGSGLSQSSWDRNVAVRFTGTVFGGISANTTYYIQYSYNGDIKIAASKNTNTSLDLTTASGSMYMELVYDEDLCQRDMNKWIDAVKYDLKYPGNYKSLFCSRYYGNAVVGSLEEDMFYLRDATGLRDMTLADLSGDVLAPNEYGTSRVSAGAYASLDPGWGPEDYRVWIQTRSPYVQGLTTFGNAAIGQKIDGALHNGGNDSITSNDFTQVISDGIGAWVANNGRAELVSVFTYYAHIGYLATEGGRIRGTNGNNSYGTFGAVAEGVDPTEDQGLAVVDNKFQFVSTVGSVFGDGDKFYQLEFENAGEDYTEVEWTFTGGGLSAASENDEFRDDGIFQVRLLDFGDDSSGQFGGSGYISNANTAQGGTSSSITLAATDGEVNSAYVGMVVYVTGGTGVGQFGFVTSYNSGTKLATVVKYDGSSGWEHVIPGTSISSPDASSTYVVEPRITFSSPGFSNTNANLPAAATWTDCVYGNTNSSYVSLSGTYSGNTGAGATFTVIRNGYKYLPVVQSGGSGYIRLETITIDGANLGGITTTNDLVITITAVDETTGEILEFDQDGYGIGGTFVAVQSGSRQIATSQDGASWTNVALGMPSTSSWSALAYGTFNDGSTLERTDTARFVAVASGGTSAAYSNNGVSWTASILPASATWSSIAFGNGRFVAIASNSTTVAVSFDGEIWDVTGTLPSTGFTAVTYGRGKFVAVKTGDVGAVAYSTTGTDTWTADDMPASSAWASVTWGNNKFVATATNSNNGAYSFDGETWSAMTIGSVDGSSTSGFQKVKYGQGLFMATAYQSAVQDYSFVVTSEDGINWTVRGVLTPGDVANTFSGWKSLAFGNPQRIGKWAVLPFDSEQTTGWIRTGATAKARAFVAEEKIFAIRITEPGSGYDSLPTMTITDPNNIYEAPFSVRKSKGVLAQPSWTNRGAGYTTASAEVFSGDGYADNFQTGSFVAVRRMSISPVAGSNVEFAGLPGRTFKLVNVITFLGTNPGAFTSFYQVSPALTIAEATALTHLSGVETRIRYSQVRLTGHDFLDIGTGGFTSTNYPNQPLVDPSQPNETVENNGGRVFFTATDQDGNFRVGDLFSVEQSTGVATLNADAFNISGLQELNLGDLTLGGGSATVTEFSTDPFFTADSDSVVPTQRAIKAYIAAQIGGGGAALNVNSVTAGSIKISSNVIENISGTAIKMNATFNFTGGVIGLPLAFHYFLQ